MSERDFNTLNMREKLGRFHMNKGSDIPDPDEDEQLDLRDEKEINKDIKKLKARKFIHKTKHFPALIGNFVKNSLVGFVIKWLIIGGVIIALFLHFTDTYTSLYYKIVLGYERSKNERIEHNLRSNASALMKSDDKIKCYREQFQRIADEKQVDINFCKKIK